MVIFTAEPASPLKEELADIAPTPVAIAIVHDDDVAVALILSSNSLPIQSSTRGKNTTSGLRVSEQDREREGLSCSYLSYQRSNSRLVSDARKHFKLNCFDVSSLLPQKPTRLW